MKKYAFGMALTILFTIAFVLMYGGASWLNALWQRDTFSLALAWERDWPLYPAWAWVYVSLPCFLLLVVWRLDWQAQWRLFVVLLGALFSGCLFFVLLPVGLSFPHEASDSVVLQLAYTMGMAHNYWPSLHCAFVVVAAQAWAVDTIRFWRIWLWIYALAVVISTVAIHAHHVADAVSGCLLAWLLWRPLSCWAYRADVLAYVAQQKLWLENQLQFAQRHRRYAFISIILYIQYFTQPKRARLLMAGYCFLQAYDDVMDGDRPYSGSLNTPSQYAEQIIRAWQAQNFSGSMEDELVQLGKYFQHLLQDVPDTQSAQTDVLRLLQNMQFDAIRAAECQLLPENQLRRHMYETFELSLNMLFYAVSSKMRASDVPELVYALAWCSTIRDLHADLAVGIINIPAELWQRSHLPPPKYGLDGAIICHNPIIATWLAEQKQQTEQQLSQLFFRLPKMAQCYDKEAIKLVNLFAKSVAKFAARKCSHVKAE